MRSVVTHMYFCRYPKPGDFSEKEPLPHRRADPDRKSGFEDHSDRCLHRQEWAREGIFLRR